jgi:hypothetical protein
MSGIDTVERIRDTIVHCPEKQQKRALAAVHADIPALSELGQSKL